ncbi:hypothetical protein Q3G72_013212 [Acer saccharum]|nr:hypothetical protein Q3G72_013212 [Acer saccharum]
MSGVDQRNNRKRLDCLNKKSKELSALYDVEVMFLYKEDRDSSSASFHLWLEDSNAWKRNEMTHDDHAIFVKKLHKSKMGFLKESEGLQL